MKCYAHARAADVMSTKSANGFEWSVKHIGHDSLMVGIASQVAPGSFIFNSDQNSILYDYNANMGGSSVIRIGSTIHSKPKRQQTTGDVIHFKFQPQTKKLVIELVRVVFAAAFKLKVLAGTLRMSVTKLICETTSITFLLFNLMVIQP